MSVVERERVVAEPTTRDVLLRAADLLSEFGWQQGGLGSKLTGQFCLVGAVVEAARDLGAPYTPSVHDDEGIYDYANRFLRSFEKEYPEDWNDAEGRTKAEVVARLRAAAEAV